MVSKTWAICEYIRYLFTDCFRKISPQSLEQTVFGPSLTPPYLIFIFLTGITFSCLFVLFAPGLRNHEAIVQRTQQIVQPNLVLLDEFFSRYPDLFKWHRPQACTIGFLELKSWLLKFGDGGAQGMAIVMNSLHR